MRRGTLLLLALALVACGIVLAPARGEEAPRSGATAPGLVELVGERTAYSKTFAGAAGRRTTRIYAEPIHERAADGGWQPLSTRFERSGAAGYESAGSDGFRAALPADLGAAPIAAGAGDDQVRLELIGGDGTPRVDGATATYADALPGVTASYRATARALKEDLSLHGPASPRRFEFALRLRPGLTPRLAGNQVEVVDGDGRVVLHMPAPFMFERDDPADMSTAVAFGLRRGSGGWRLTVTAADAWLEEPGRSWPVVVDPTIQRPSSIADCTLQENQNQWRSCGAPAGLMTGDEYLALLKFNMPALPSGHAIDTAVLVAHLTSRDLAPDDVQAVAAGRAWDPACVSWKYATCTTQWSGSGGTQYAEAGETIPAEDLTATGPKEWDVTKIAKSWAASGMSSNHGVWLKGMPNAGSRMTFASSADADPAKRPYLEFSHDLVTTPDNTIEAPTPGEVTGKRLPLQGRMTTKTITGVEWEYKAPTQRHWQTIPAAAVRTARGAAITWPVPVTHGTAATSLTPDLTWDLTATPGVVDGPVKVRARYVGTGGGVTPKVADVRLHRKDPAADASAPIGPGSVNLLTGNFSVDRTDVAIESFKSDLTLSRTYNSRGENRRTADMFGPGWESSVGADGPGMQFRGIYSFTDWQLGEVCYEPEDPEDPVSYDEPAPAEDPLWFDEAAAVADEYDCFPEYQQVSYAILERLDGSRTKYWVNGASFVPDDASNTLRLIRTDATHLTLTDAQGNKTIFESAATGAPEYRPTRYEEPAATNRTQFVYGTVTENGQPKFRLERAFAPSANSSCDPSVESDPGCRRLRFEYSQSGPPRLVAVHFKSYDPVSAAMVERKVVAYRYDATGRLAKAYDPRLPNAPGSTEPPGEAYAYDSTGRLVSIAPGPDAPWRMEYGRIATDSDPARLLNVRRSNLDASANTTSVVYNVSLSGTGAPHDMSFASVNRWGQNEGRSAEAPKGIVWNDVPTDATAIIPPNPSTGAGGGLSPSSLARGTIFYMDRRGLAVNTARPGGGVSFTGHDQHGNVVRELTATNRAKAIAAGATMTADQLSTLHTYDYSQEGKDDRGVELKRTLGPRHEVRLKSGATVMARRETQTVYDEGAPAGDPHLPTTVEVGALLDGGLRADVRRTTYGYRENNTNRGWDLRDPSEVVVDPGRLNLKTTIVHHPTEPLVIARKTPAGANEESSANKTEYYYYGSEQVATTQNGIHHADCKNRTYWYGMLCLAKPADAPSETPLSRVTRYDYLLQPEEEITQGQNGAQSVATTVRDAAGRPVDVSETGTRGAALPSVRTTYDAATGRAVELRTTTAQATRTLSQGYDALGRPTAYTDATGNVATTTYDRLNRPVTTNDGKGSQTRYYDGVTGRLIRLEDSGLGSFTATYDADGRLASETLPNGLTAASSYDESGARRALTYTKTAGCTESCVWLSSSVKASIHGQWLEHDGSLSDQRYGYDDAGRLTRVDDTVTGQACTVREYDYDADSNRTASVSIPAAADGTCSTDRTRGQTRTHTYSANDRITDAGYVHDDLGRVTRVPGVDANGGDLTSSYYVNDLVETLSQNGVEQRYDLDPLRRAHTRKTTATSGTTTETYRYADGSDEPAWIGEGTSWTRFVSGIGGGLGAVETSGGQKLLQLHNLHGDVVAEATLNTAATAPSATFETDEFGVPRQSSSRRYGYLGTKQRSRELAGGAMQMGVRTYLPSLGRFLAMDPVEGGSANAYDYANQDPVNQVDLDGRAAEDFNWHYARTHVAIFNGREIGRTLVELTVRLRGKYVEVSMRLTTMAGGLRYARRRIQCREEHFPFDDSCGTRTYRGTFVLNDDANYHVDFKFWARAPRGRRGLVPFYKRSPQFSCRRDRTYRCRFN